MADQPSSTNLFFDVAATLWAEVVFCLALFWKWPVLSAVSIFIGGVGVGAMYGGSYILAAGFYFVCVVLLTARFVAEARTQGRKGVGLAVIVVIGALVFWGLLWLVSHTYETQTHQDNAFATAAAWAWSRFATLWKIPWRWVFPAVVFGFVFSALVAVIRERQQRNSKGAATRIEPCSYQWTHDLADSQVNQINRFVVAEKPLYYNERLKEPIPSIGFKFPVRNRSLFDISIDENVTGEIYYNDTELIEARTVKHAGGDIGHGQLDGLTIEQRLTPTEANHIATTDGTFHFSALGVTIKGGKLFPQVKPRRLEITEHEHALKHERERIEKSSHKLKLTVITRPHPDKNFEFTQSGFFISSDIRPIAPYGTETDKTKFILRADIYAQYENEDTSPVRVEWVSATLLAETRELNLDISTLEDGQGISNQVVIPASEKSAELCFEITGELDISWRALLNWRSCLRIRMKAIRQEVYCIDLTSEQWEHAWTTSQKSTFEIRSAGDC
jgi:hypothetical protein